MRLFLLLFLSVVLFGCGAAATDAGGVDASVDAAPDAATADAVDSATADTADTGTADAPCPGPDAAGGDGGASAWAGTLFLNEIQAGGTKVNPATATDTDWIELYNAGCQAIDLSGYKVGGITNGLAGASALPASTSIAAGGFLVVYFNKLALGWPVIAGGIKSDGSMAIWDTGGLLVDSVDWAEGASPAGSTYDRTPDGSATWQTVTPPTPGKPNSK